MLQMQIQMLRLEIDLSMLTEVAGEDLLTFLTLYLILISLF